MELILFHNGRAPPDNSFMATVHCIRREAHEGNVWCLQCIACSFYKALDPLPMSLRDAVAGRTCSPYSHTASGVPTGRQRCPTCDKKAIACFSPPLPHKGFCTVPFRWIMPCNDNAGRYPLPPLCGAAGAIIVPFGDNFLPVTSHLVMAGSTCFTWRGIWDLERSCHDHYVSASCK